MITSLRGAAKAQDAADADEKPAALRTCTATSVGRASALGRTEIAREAHAVMGRVDHARFLLHPILMLGR
jgi:hypothetical protein